MNKKTKGLVTVLSVCVVLLIVLSAVLLNVNKKEEPVTDNTVAVSYTHLRAHET